MSSRELYSMICTGPFQFEILHDTKMKIEDPSHRAKIKFRYCLM